MTRSAEWQEYKATAARARFLIDSDAVFGVKQSLVREFPTVDDPQRAAEVGLPNPFRAVHFDVGLRAGDDREA